MPFCGAAPCRAKHAGQNKSAHDFLADFDYLLRFGTFCSAAEICIPGIPWCECGVPLAVRVCHPDDDGIHGRFFDLFWPPHRLVETVTALCNRHTGLRPLM